MFGAKQATINSVIKQKEIIMKKYFAPQISTATEGVVGLFYLVERGNKKEMQKLAYIGSGEISLHGLKFVRNEGSIPVFTKPSSQPIAVPVVTHVIEFPVIPSPMLPSAPVILAPAPAAAEPVIVTPILVQVPLPSAPVVVAASIVAPVITEPVVLASTLDKVSAPVVTSA